MSPNNCRISLIVVVFHLMSCCLSVPILPIIAAIAGRSAEVLNVDIDLLGIAKWMKESATIKKNRSGFVKDLMYTAFHKSDHKYNVLVFNLNEDHKHILEGIRFYASADYIDGTKFGVWVFDSGSFTNLGARGWDNWAMVGSFSKDTTGRVVTFRKRKPAKKSNRIPEVVNQNNIFCDFRDK